MTKFNWEGIDEKYKYTIVNRVGTRYLLEDKPIIKNNIWIDTGTSCISHSTCDITDWKNSLEERPTPERSYTVTEISAYLQRRSSGSVADLDWWLKTRFHVSEEEKAAVKLLNNLGYKVEKA